MPAAPWFSFQEQVAREYADDGAVCETDRVLAGTNVDVLVRQRLPDGRDIVTAIECKAHNCTINLPAVQKFGLEYNALRSAGLVDSAVMISSRGFSRQAREHAEHLRIALLTLDDLQNRITRLRQCVDDFVQHTASISHVGGPEFIPLAGMAIEGSPVPDILTHLAAWFDGPAESCVLLGDGGAGKTTIASRFALEVGRRSLGQSTHRYPLYVDLRRAPPAGRITDILNNALARQGIQLPHPRIATLIRTGRLCVILDGIDELELGNVTSRLLREFTDLEELLSPNSKILVTCRLGSFRSQDELLGSDFATRILRLPADMTAGRVIRIAPLDRQQVEAHLRARTAIGRLYPDVLPDVLFDVCQRPLHLKMVARSIGADATREVVDSIGSRSTLYDTFVTKSIEWDMTAPGTALPDSMDRRRIYEALAAEMLNKGSLTADEGVTQAAFARAGLQDRLSTAAVRDILRGTLLSSTSGGTVWAHKTYGEYLGACHILNLVRSGSTTFPFIWFTRAERDFLSDMLTEDDIRTLRSWLVGSTYVPKQFAAFIFGGLPPNPDIISLLGRSMTWSGDTLTNINCINALAFLGEKGVAPSLFAIIGAYLEFKGVTGLPLPQIGVPPTGAVSAEHMLELSREHGMQAVVLHVRESVEGLSLIADSRALPFLHTALMDDNPDFVAEVRSAVSRLTASVGDTS